MQETEQENYLVSSSRPLRLPVAPANAGPRQPAPVAATTWGPTRCLIVATALAGFLGIPLGLLLGYWAGAGQMGAVPWTGLVQAHGQVQLFGWLGLAILGVTFHAMAHLFQAAEPPARLVTLVLLLQLAGVLLRLAAPLVPAGADAGGAWLLVGSAAALLAAFAITLEAHVRTLPRRSRERRAPPILPRFLLVGIVLWFGALLANLDGAVQALLHGPIQPGTIDAQRDAFIVAAMTGGLAMFAAGMSLRAIVGWLDLPAPDLRQAGRAWRLLAPGAVLRAVHPLWPDSLPALAGMAAALGASLWAAGVLAYLPVLRGLWAPDAVRQGEGAQGRSDPPLAWFVRTAYAWFAVSGALAAVEAGLAILGLAGVRATGMISTSAVADAGRHALLFGYLGTLTVGLTGRLPSAFLDLGDAALDATRGRYRATWVLLLVASALQVAAPFAGGLRPAALMAAGALGAAGLVCLLAVLAHFVCLASRRDRRLLARAVAGREA